MQSIVHITPSENGKETQSTEDRKQFSYSSPPTANTSTQKGQNLASLQTHFMADLSESDDEEVSEVDSFIIEQGDIDEEPVLDTSKFLLASEGSESPDLRSVDPETQARLEALLEAAGKLSTPDGKHLADPEVLRKLTSSVSCALDEAAAALTRMRAENSERLVQGDSIRSLAEACTDGDVGTVRKLLDEGRSVHETTEEGESLLSLACSAGYFELAQVLLAMRANVEDRGIKGDCTPLMEAASSGHADIVKLLIAHGADVNAQSSSGNTPLMYACAGGFEDVVTVLLDAGSNVEDHNENGHTPLMEAASAGHVNVARILLQHGAGINTHSNEFKESALTLACYKGHLEMVRFLLEAGADQEHKTDEMHTALMEASMDGHVDVARLLLDSGAQVNMPADSFESPLTLAACGGHVELAMLLLERGANIEEVNDEGYTPLMEAAREGHEEMVALLLSQGADINAQTEETQETALTLACCGGFLDVADFLIKAGADIELGASTPLMEAAQEGHLDLVRYLLDAGTNVHAQTQTGDTALTYACENGHTDVADLLLQAGADLEHQSEGGRTPLMKAARAGHLCTVQFLISRGADVNRQTTNNDHTPLSLACAGGHLPVVELLLAHGADPTHQLKDNSTMLIEAAKGGHIGVVQLLLDYPHNMMTSPPPDPSQLTPPNMDNIEAPRVPPHGLQVVVAQDMDQNVADAAAYMNNVHSVPRLSDTHLNIRDTLTPSQPGSVKQTLQKQLLRSKNNSMRVTEPLTTAELQQIKNAPQITPVENLPPDLNYHVENLSMDSEEKDLKRSERFEACINKMMKEAESKHSNKEEQIIQKQQILEELHRVERELQEKAQAQLLLNAAAAQHQQRLDHHQQQLQVHGNIPVSVTLSSSMSSPVVMTTAATIASSMVNPEILGMTEMTALGKLNNHVNIEFSDTLNVPLTLPLPSDIMNVDKQKGKQSNSKKEAKNKRQHQEEHILSSSDSEDSTISMSGLQIDSLPVEEQQLMNPEALQTLSLKAIAQSEHAGIIADFHAAHTAEAKLSSELMQNSNFNFFDATGTSQNLAAQSGVQALSISVANVADKKSLIPQNAIVQQTKNHLNTLDTHSFVGSIPLDSSVMVTLGGVGAPGFPVSLAMTSGMMAATPVTLSPAGPATVPLLDEGLMVAAPARTLHETLGDMTGSIAHLTNSPQAALVNHQVAQQYISTNTVATQCIEQNLTPQAATNTLQLPFLTNTAATTSTVVSVATASSQIPLQTMPSFPSLNVNSQTDSNRDTALTLACAGGHDDLVQLLLNRGANLEHRDKKGFTPLILAATAGHARVVEILLNHRADIEAQSERTKDTPLSLACSGGRYEVVELLLGRGANKEHRNVSDYTPLSLAASGGYVNIIKLLLNYGAEINSRTNSKLGISPLMLAAMNGHTAAVKLLLDNGGDINAQIETNRNTALTLACFQGRHEVVSLLVDRKANVEHRAKTGLTPLMEAASGGYVEVGRVLLDKGADVNAPPVPSSRDTALTIAADKGHYRFVELLLSRGAQVDVKNKKGNSPLWLAANGGHLDVVQLLVSAGADIDSQDNRKVSCLMAAFRKGHIKVVKWMVRHVTQFPSDQEMTRYIATITDKDLMKKCHQCMENIRVAKDRQAVEANKYATILLEELDMEKTREESKKAAAARRRERKRKKKKEKQEKKLLEENKKNESKNAQNQINENHIASSTATSNEDEPLSIEPPCATTTTTIGTVITTTSKSSKQNNNLNLKNQTAKVKVTLNSISASNSASEVRNKDKNPETESESSEINEKNNATVSSVTVTNDFRPNAVTSVSNCIGNSNGCKDKSRDKLPADKKEKKEAPKENRTVGSREAKNSTVKDKMLSETSGKTKLTSLNVSCSSASTSTTTTTTTVSSTNSKSSTVIAGTSSSNNKRKKSVLNQFCPNEFIELAVTNENSSTRSQKNNSSGANSKKNELSLTNAIENYVGLAVDSYEITNVGNVRNPSSLANIKSPPASVSSPKRGSKREDGWKEVVRRSKKVLVPSNAISRVIGRGGCNINAIREVSGAHIEVEKQKGAGDRTVIIKGSTDSTRQAHQLISALIKDPDRDLIELLPRSLANKSSSQSKAIYSASSNTSSQASSVTTCNTQSKVSLVAFSSSSSSLSSLSSSSSSSASVAASSSVSSLATRVNKSNSVTSNPTIGIYSTPPFPVSHQGISSRPSVPNASNSRPGIPVSPLSSAFANNNVPAWPVSNLASNGNNSVSPKRITLIRSTSITTTTTNVVPGNVVGNLFGGLDGIKSSAVRQLFPNDKRTTVTTQSSNTNTKTTVSYTTAASSQGKTTLTVSSNDVSFASKVTTYKLGMSTAQNRAPGKTTVTNIRSAQSSPNINQPVAVDPSLTITTNSAHALNGPVSHTVGAQHRSQPNTPISTGNLIMPMPNSVAPGHPKSSAPQEYSPFNSFFSQVAQQSVWGKEKEGDNRGMNFASVAASNMKPIGSSIPNASSVPVPVPSNETQPVDESKAPGYRGNSHISPSSNSASSAPISVSSSNSLPNSAPNTPPIGPIAPPNSLVHSRRSPSPLIQNSPIGPGSLHGRSPIESPILSNAAPVVSNVQMNAAVLQLSNLAPGAPSSVSSPNSAGSHNPPLNLLANQGPPISPNLIRPLQLNPPTSNYPPASSPHAPSPRFTTPLSMPNTLLTQNNGGSIGNSSSLPIQSNLNPNAPDFSSRAPSGLVNSHQPPLSFILNRMNPFGDGPTHQLSAFRPMIAVTSANAFSPAPLAPPQGGPNRLPFLLPLQQRLPSQPQNQQVCSSSELTHQSIPSGSILSGSAVTEPVRVMGNTVVFAHRQQALGNAPVPVPIGPQPLGTGLNTHYQSMQGQLLLNQRSVASTPSMGTSSKDEESPIATISPVASPQTSNPDSPTGIGINAGSLSDHQVKAIGEDRKFLRPIGTERAHRKTPVLSRISDVDGIWSYPSGINSDWLPNSEVQSEAQENSNSLYMSRFDDNLGTIENQQHGLEPFQPTVIAPPSVATSMGINSSFPHFVNGFPPHMLSQLYGGGNGNGLMNETWPNSVKLGAGDSAAPGQTSSPNPIVLQDQKMVWNNWNQPQM